MGSISVKIHRQFTARAPGTSAGSIGRPLREMGPLLAEREPRAFGALAPAGRSRALSILLELSLLIAWFFAGALVFAYLSRRW
jgi:hypothetical protein